MALDEEKQALDDEDLDLGLPRAHDEASISGGQLERLKDAAGRAITGRLETGAKELGTYWMESLQKLHGDVQKAFADGLQPLVAPGAELLEFRKKVNTVRAIVNGVVSTWIDRAPRDLSQNIRRWLDMDDSLFRLGRFVGLLEAVERKAFQLLDDSKLAILGQLSKRVGLLLEDPMSAALTASFFATSTPIGKPVTVGIRADVMADAIIRDIVMSAFGEFVDGAAGKLNQMSFYPNVKWIEGCAQRRTELIKTLALIEKGRQHIATTLEVTDDLEGLYWVPANPTRAMATMLDKARRAAELVGRKKAERAENNRQILLLKKQKASLIRSPAPTPRAQSMSPQEGYGMMYVSSPPTEASLGQQIMDLKDRNAGYYTELEKAYRDLSEIKQQVAALLSEGGGALPSEEGAQFFEEEGQLFEEDDGGEDIPPFEGRAPGGDY
jgi:hypothetical protein